MISDKYSVVSPIGIPADRVITPAKPLDTLEGKKIGLCWAAFGNGNVLLEAFDKLLHERYANIETVYFNPGKDRKPSHYSDPSIMDVAKEAGIDAAIVAVGGCGTCTPGVTRAACWIEEAGIPATAMICKGFVNPSRSMAAMEGLRAIRITEFPPPNIVTQTADEVYQNAEKILDTLIQNLTTEPPESKVIGMKKKKYTEHDIVFEGTFEEVNAHFLENGWADGLPIVPPTPEKVAEFLKYTDRNPDDVIGVLKPSKTKMTVYSVAVNGVIAGCRPSYMPVLLAIAEAVSTERFAIYHAGSTAGWTPIVFLNGPIRKELGFNCGQGALRPGNQANMSIGRFVRFIWTNLAGFKLGATDLAAIGRNFLPVLPENEENSPYPPLSEDFGFEAGKNVVTIMSCGSMTFHFTTEATAEEHLQLLAEEFLKEMQSEFTHILCGFGQEVRPGLLLSPMTAKVLAEAGIDKQGIRDYIFEHARMPASKFDHELNRLYPGQTLKDFVVKGLLDESFAESDDPNRLLPLTHNNKELVIIVAGFESRNRSCFIQQIAHQGLPVAKEITLPKDWENLPK